MLTWKTRKSHKILYSCRNYFIAGTAIKRRTLLSNVEQGRIRTTQRTSMEQQKCPVCKKQGHTTSACKQFKEADVNARWDIAKKKYLCFRCLKHRTKKHSCRGKPCAIDDCHRLHHNMLYVKKEKPVDTEERTRRGRRPRRKLI